METLNAAGLAAGIMLLACGAAQAGDYDWDDIFAPYTQRIDTATATSGNAKNVNATTHVITPWPPYVHNRRIPGDGARMVGAVERYQNPLSANGAAPESQSAAPAASDRSGSSGGAGETGQTETSGQSGQ